jgi:hypothetical protein
MTNVIQIIMCFTCLAVYMCSSAGVEVSGEIKNNNQHNQGIVLNEEEEDLYVQWRNNHTSRLQAYGGDWLRASSPDVCEASTVCVNDKSFGNITWQPGNSNFDFFNNQTACDKLKHLKYNKIYFVGDSFVRHLYQAFLLLFTGNYDYGSLNAPNKHCKGDMQFTEKRCSGVYGVSKPYRDVCQWTGHPIKLVFWDVFNFRATPDQVPWSDARAMLVWSEGSHPALFNYTPAARDNDGDADGGGERVGRRGDGRNVSDECFHAQYIIYMRMPHYIL